MTSSTSSSPAPTGVSRYIWWVLGVGFMVTFLSSSIKTTYQVFFVQMTASFGLDRGGFAVAMAVFMLVFGISSPLVGYLSDRIGPSRTIKLGIALAGVAFIGCGVSDSFAVFVVLYGVVAAFGLTAMSYVPMGLLVDRTMAEQRKGLAYAFLTNGAAIGFIVLSPLWVFIQGYLSWQHVYTGLGLFFLFPMLLAVHFGLPDTPAPTTAQGVAAPPFLSRLKLVFATRPYYALLFGFAGCGVTMAFIDVHMVAYLQDLKLSPGQISATLVVLGVTELVGGLIAGWMCDRYPKGLVIAGFYLLRASAMFVLYLFPTPLGVMVFSALFGLSYLGTVIGTSMYTLALFGPHHKGFAFGIIWLSHQVGAFLSTQLGANAFDWFGNYTWTILVTGGVAVMSFLISMFMLPLNPRPAAGEA